MKLGNNRRINAEVQARIDPPPTPLIRTPSGKVEECNIIKIKMRQYSASVTSNTYELKVQTYKNGKPEEFLQMMKDFKTTTDGIGTNSATGKIQFLRTMLCGEDLREFYVLAIRFGITTNGHLKWIKEGLLGHFPPLYNRNKQKHAMRHAIKKPQNLLFRRFHARLTELNN